MRSIARSYLLMLKWQALSSRVVLPINLVVQLMIAAGFIIGIGFFYPEMTPETAKFLTTGAPTIILLIVGLVLLPQIVAMGREAGTYDYMWSLPVPRLVYLAADATIWVLVSLPGVIVALVLGSLYFDFSLQISGLVLPAVLLISATGVFIGYIIAHGAPKPQLAALATQIIVFLIMLFSPVMYPATQLPAWLVDIHRVFPVMYMADLSRGTLTDIPVDLGLAFAVVGAWFVVGLTFTTLLVRRRR